MKSIGINEDMHRRLKLLSIVSNLKIYELVLEAINLLERKYIHESSSNRPRIESG